MKLLFTSDLHGSESHYERLVGVVERESPDVIILGGDLFPDDSALNAKALGTGQPKYIASKFRNTVTRLRQAGGCEHVLVIFGNHDWASSIAAIQALETDGLVSLVGLDKPVKIEGVSFLGYWHTPPTPWFVKDFERLDRPDDDPPLIGGARWDIRLNRMKQQGARVLYESAPSMEEELADVEVPIEPWVWVMHAPPINSNLDQAYGNLSWGSYSVRGAIEKYKPLLTLHGHIHESPEVTGQFSDKIGSTTSVNPGQSAKDLCYAVIEIDPASKSITNLRHGRQS